MYEFIENLNQKEYENFVFNNYKAHFMQSCYWGDVQKIKNFKPHFVGMKKDNILVATALILEKKVLKNLGYMYCPRGFILDYTNLELIKEFTKYIKKYTKKNKDFFFRMDPDIKLNTLDIKGNILKDENHRLVQYLCNIGYKHNGFNKDFENSEPRYTFRLNIDREIDEIFKNFHPTTRKILNKENQYNLNIYKGDVNDIEVFYETMIETSKRENIIPSKIEYYKNFYQILNKQNMSDIYIIKVNIEELKNKYNTIINDINNEIKKIENNEKKNIEKSNNLILSLKDKLVKMNKELEEIKKITEKELTLSSIITTKYKDKVWTIHGGNHTLLRFLNANYLLYYEIIKDANKEGYKVIDFFGTTGNPDPNNYIYGIHLFKQRLGGEYTEFIGEFDLITNKLLYFLYNKYKHKKKLH